MKVYLHISLIAIYAVDKDAIASTFFITALAVLGLMLFFGVISLLSDRETQKSISKFEEDLLLATKNKALTWEQVKIIAETRGLSREDIKKALNELLRDALTGSKEDITAYTESFEKYIHHYLEEEPFADIPNDIKIHLERLLDHLPKDIHLLDPLVAQLKEFSMKNIKERRKQTALAIVSLLVGIIGLAFGLYSVVK